MIEKPIEDIVNTLKEIIDREGTNFLEDEPYQMYEKLIESGNSDRKTAAALLYLLAGGLLESNDPGNGAELIADVIRSDFSIKKQMADRLAIILCTLYSDHHKRDWRLKEKEGLKSFLKEDFLCEWKGFAIWDGGTVTISCYYEARMILRPTKAVSEDKELERLMEKNPFTTKEIVCDLFRKRLLKYLDYEFDVYCTDDDYYEPCVEDYGMKLEDDLKEWSEKNGFEFVSCEGKGEDGGYEPKFKRGWY